MKRACAAVEVPVPESYNRLVAKTRSRDLTDRGIYFYWGTEFEGDNDIPPSNCGIGADTLMLPPSNCGIGADAPASAAFGKTAFTDFAVMVYRGPRRS